MRCDQCVLSLFLTCSVTRMGLSRMIDRRKGNTRAKSFDATFDAVEHAAMMMTINASTLRRE